ncbi:MAG TPA: glycosyltransferase family 1 protein [Gammaproteobacteria bacterium]|nr:glycosyltransferase family 1 protein [Gammaproteobacteria bacterium]
MKIAQVCPYDIYQPGGVQTHIRDLSFALQQAGHDVRIIAPGEGEGAEGVFHAGKKRRLNFNKTNFEISLAMGSDYQRLRRYLLEEQFDVIHYHTIWTPLLPFQILRLSSAADVATFHDTPPDTVSGKLTRCVFRMISRRLLPRLDGVIAVSRSPAGHLVSVPQRQPKILPPSSDFSAFFKNKALFNEYRDGCVNILFLGRLEDRKGIMVLMRAYAKLCETGQNVRLLVAGDGEQKSDVLDFIAQNKLKNVEMLGRISEEDKARWYETCDIFCSPAKYGESFGIVLVEAMASGKAVVAAANNGYRTVLQGEGARFLTAPGEVDDLFEKLSLLVQQPELRKALGEWGIKQAKKYDISVVVKTFEQIYESALLERSKRVAL